MESGAASPCGTFGCTLPDKSTPGCTASRHLVSASGARRRSTAITAGRRPKLMRRRRRSGG
eukprot:1055817-Prymnesium_polylepis.1